MSEASWWHTIELAPGVVTPGSWDLRPTAARIPWPPAGLDGLRCLDVGTMDGFWAFEMERRGATDVLAIDIVPPRETFQTAADRLASRVDYRQVDVCDLDPVETGTFDVVFVGYVLQMVPDPLRALAALRRICSGWFLVLETVSAPLSLLPAPLARLDARRGAFEWFVFNRAGLAKALTLSGFDVEVMTPTLRDVAGPAIAANPVSWWTKARHAAGILGRSVAIRARPAGPGR